MKSPKTLIERYTAAVIATDRDALMQLYAPNVRVYDTMLPWEFRTADAWSTFVENWFSGVRANPQAEASNVDVVETDGMALLTMFMYYGHTEDDGELVGLTNRLTWVAVPDGDDWKIIHEHTSSPLNMEDMTPQFEP